MAPGTIRMNEAEKRVKILEVFHDTKDFFTLKEVEKLASKKGVVEKTVKDILQTMVSEGIVQSDKIGTSNFFWAFPSARGTALKNQLAKATEERASLQAKVSELTRNTEVEEAARIPSAERNAALAHLNELQAELSKLQAELNAYGQCNPEQAEMKRRANELAREAALRWTENIIMTRDHIVRVANVPASEINTCFGIKDDFEDLE